MLGLTAEKHDSFLEPAGDGSALAEFAVPHRQAAPAECLDVTSLVVGREQARLFRHRRVSSGSGRRPHAASPA
jgi:hypothetical protein